MNKKFWVGFIIVAIGLCVTNILIHVVLLGDTYRSAEMANMMRPESEQKTWIHIVSAFITAFFFTLIYVKGYEGKGIAEGARFGLYVGIMMSMPMAYDTYAAMTIPYSLALRWFCYGVIQYIILGILVAATVGKKPIPVM
ncbi:MAG TPA: hypothetical protein VL633_12985 [Bacteroidota bacterium]|jgi:hypothetical protein|nr:hypothetical protein [Bacteroidota bacterium]